MWALFLQVGKLEGSQVTGVSRGRTKERESGPQTRCASSSMLLRQGPRKGLLRPTRQELQSGLREQEPSSFPVTCWVSFGKSFSLSEPQFPLPHLAGGMDYILCASFCLKQSVSSPAKGPSVVHIGLVLIFSTLHFLVFPHPHPTAWGL